MTTTTQHPLVLPDYLDGDAPLVAHLEQGPALAGAGRRTLTWTLKGPRELFRNRYATAWIDVKERDFLAGDGRVWLSATRRIGDDYQRVSWTPTGRQRLEVDVLPNVEGYGFSRLWNETHQAAADHLPAIRAKRTAEREVQWWRAKAQLVFEYHAGRIVLGPLTADATPSYRRQVTKLVPASYSSGSHSPRVTVIGELFDHSDLPAGWMTTSGDPIPDDAILQEGR